MLKCFLSNNNNYHCNCNSLCYSKSLTHSIHRLIWWFFLCV